MKHTFESELWLYTGDKASWHFLTVPKDLGEELEAETLGPRRGFGAIRVNVCVGKTEWKTSIFPDKKRGYILPVKKSVREAESLTLKNSVIVEIEVLD